MESLSDNREIRILLMEDDEDDYVIVRDLLGSIHGRLFDIQWARNMEQGMDYAQKYRNLPYVGVLKETLYS